MDKFSDVKNSNIQQWAYDLDCAAKKVGFYWTSIDQILDKINSEVVEIREAIAANESKARVSEEIGDLIFVCCEFMPLFGIES